MPEKKTINAFLIVSFVFFLKKQYRYII